MASIWRDSTSFSTYYGSTKYTEMNRFQDEVMSREEYDQRYPRQAPSTCTSCGLTHGATKWYGVNLDKCEITMVKEMEAQEAKVKKHNENIRKLYWERFASRKSIGVGG